MADLPQVDVLDYQPSTRRSKRPFWPAPPGIVFNLWVVLLSGASLWIWRVPHGTFLLGPLLALLWSVTGVLWMSKFFPHLRALCGRGGSQRRRRLAILPLVLMTITGALVATDVPRRTAFALSKPAMLSLAESQTARYVGRAGVYHVRLRRDDRGGVIFETNSIGIFSYAGYAYFPNGAPVTPGGMETFTPLGDGWYIYRLVD